MVKNFRLFLEAVLTILGAIVFVAFIMHGVSSWSAKDAKKRHTYVYVDNSYNLYNFNNDILMEK